MINIELNGTAPTHVERIAPQFSVDETGKITWLPGLVDYDASLFYRGKTVTNDEFNTLFLRNVYQGNYITDSLSELFDEHLSTAIYRSFTSDFNLVPSYVKSFGPSDWGTLQSDGYYYITIPASEHGFEPDDEESALDKMNIDTEMYLLGTDGRFYEVTQVDTDSDNTVRLYTDDNTLSGFVVIRTNDKAYALAAATIDATQISGLAKVATSAKYTDLIDRTTPTGPDTRIAANAANIAALMSDTEYEDYPFVHNADFATNATNANYATNLLGTGTIQNQPISTIFETGSNYVKNATTATNVSTTINGNAITNIFEEDGTTVKEATHADSATNVSTTINNKNISDIFETDGVTIKNATNATNATNAITQDTTDNSTKIATTAFVTNKLNIELENKMNKWEVLYNNINNTESSILVTNIFAYDLLKIYVYSNQGTGHLTDQKIYDLGTFPLEALNRGVVANNIAGWTAVTVSLAGGFLLTSSGPSSSNKVYITHVLGMKL